MSNPPPESGEGDATYLEKTLRHEPTDLLLDDAVSSEEIRAVWRRSIRWAIGTFLVFLLLWIINGGLEDAFEGDDDASGFIVAGLVGAIIMFVTRWIVFLAGEKQEAISEWCTLLAGRATAADSVYSHIAGRLTERQLPLHHRVERRTRTPFHTTGNRLVLIDGYHFVYVTVFGYGTSLYLGWSMWRVRKGSALLGQYFGRTSGSRLDPIERILNLDRLRAMREAVHAVCREALHAAVQDVHFPEEYGFPNRMPAIEGLPYGLAPQPGGTPTWDWDRQQ